MAQTFSASVGAWAAKSRRRIDYIVKASTQRVFMQANHGVPVDTGFAQASFRATLNSPDVSVTFRPMNTPAGQNQGGSQSFFPDDNAVALVIAGATIGKDVIYGTWVANYVSYLEYGTQGRPALGFVRKAAQDWQMIVDQVTLEAQTRIGE
ncbi:HK97 gp10 family phage protein [Hyphomicrobium sp. DY-1]|uniref:HK97 gp10 family phage protein n=1 Tax=Hyphomicrobium sp. DY-1 TaxID=3075650 RepID=UPI0039C28E8D